MNAERIIDSLPGVFCCLAPDGKLLRWNRKFEEVTEYGAAEIPRLQPLSYFDGKARPGIAAWMSSVYERGTGELEATIVSRSGKRRLLQLSLSVAESPAGRCLVGLGTDITERKRTEERQTALARLGQRLSCATTVEEAGQILGDVVDDLFGWDACAVNMYANGAFYPLLSMDIIDGQRRHIPRGDSPGVPSARALRVMQQGAELFLFDSPQGFATEANPFGNTRRPSAAIMMAPIRSRGRAVGILNFQSYTPRAYDEPDLRALQTLADHCSGALERIRTEQELRDAELRFHFVWDNSVDGMRLTDERGVIVAVNDAYCRLVGLSATDLMGAPFTTTYADTEDRDKILLKYQQRVQTRGLEQKMERTLTFRSGRTVDLEVTNSLIELPDQKRLVLGLFRDTTEQKQAEEALRKSEAQFRQLWENSRDGMRLLDAEGKFMMVNEAFCRLVEKPRGEILGHSLASIYDPGIGEEILRHHKERFDNLQLRPHQESELTLWNGKRIHVEFSNSLLEVPGQAPMLLSAMRDVTANKKAQRRIQLLEQQRALEKERDRIARDMHDDLGGSLTRITLLSEIAEAEMAGGKLTLPEEAKLRMHRIAEMSRELVRNIDEIVWAVDPGNDTLEKFASYLCHKVEEWLKGGPINFRLDVPTLLPHCFLGSDVRHDLFLVVKESLSNTIQHSGASEVLIQLKLTGAELSIVTSDNGRGFEPGETRPFANGLGNMQRRMEKIGGALTLEGWPGKGAKLALKLKLELGAAGAG